MQVFTKRFNNQKIVLRQQGYECLAKLSGGLLMIFS